VQAATGDEASGYSNNIADIIGPMIISGNGDVITNYINFGAMINSTSWYYQIRLGS